MQLYCPNCRRARPLGLRCPECDTRLVAAAEAHDAALTGRVALPPPPPAPTAVGRIITGVIAALGTVVALRDLAVGVIGLAAGEESAAAAAPALGLTFATVGALAGGLLAGAGLRHGALGGGFAGACAGILLTCASAQSGDRGPLGVQDFAVACGLAAVAAIAGLVGGRVWPPAPPLPVAPVKTRGSSVARLVEEAAAETAVRPPTRWGRIALGAVVLAVGVGKAGDLLDFVGQTSVVRVQLASAKPGAVEAALALVVAALGGTVAGAVTHAGWRHGLYAGLAGAAGVGLLAATGNRAVAVPIDGLVGLAGRPPGGGLVAGLVLVGVATAGGAFGAALLPVLGKRRKLRLMD